MASKKNLLKILIFERRIWDCKSGHELTQIPTDFQSFLSDGKEKNLYVLVYWTNPHE